MLNFGRCKHAKANIGRLDVKKTDKPSLSYHNTHVTVDNLANEYWHSTVHVCARSMARDSEMYRLQRWM